MQRGAALNEGRERKRGVTQPQMCAEWGVGRAERDPIERRREDRKDAGMGEEGSLGPRTLMDEGTRGIRARLRTFQHAATKCSILCPFVLQRARVASFPELPSATPCVANDVKRRDRVLEARAASTASAHTNSPKTARACHTARLSSFLLSHALFIFLDLFVRAWVESVLLE